MQKSMRRRNFYLDLIGKLVRARCRCNLGHHLDTLMAGVARKVDSFIGNFLASVNDRRGPKAGEHRDLRSCYREGRPALSAGQ